MFRPENSFWTIPKPNCKKLPIRAPQKPKKSTKVMSNSKIRIEGNIENKTYSAIWVVQTTQYFLSFIPTPKIAHLDPKKLKWPKNTWKKQIKERVIKFDPIKHYYYA